ncbi:FapA family protein [Lachnospiraceae bacterium ZAX-1]
MEGKNGYFKLDIRDNRAYLQIFPPENGGIPLDVKEVISYLDDRNYSAYDLKELNRAVTNTQDSYEINVGQWTGYDENERIAVTISPDKMLVSCRFYPPSNKGKSITEKEVVGELNFHKITTGIDKEIIRNILKERDYCKDYVIAKGIEPVQGTDAWIEYFFNTDLNIKPKHNEDGSVDYKDLNTISHVEEDQLLATLHKEVAGKPGKDVHGQESIPRQVKPAKLDFGNNFKLSEDRTQLYSMVSGHVSLIQGKIFVSNVFEVPADVDNTIGNICYDGSVSVKGNIKAGFIVEAKGDIIVNGVVEGAILRAGGQVIVKRGINGRTKGSVTAQSNIITKFVENATLYAGGYIETGAIMNSSVSAGTDIRVRGKKGFVSGGLVRAGNSVEAQTIGSDMGGAGTKIEVGVDPAVKERYGFLQKEVVKINKEIDQIKPILKNFQDKAKQDKTKQTASGAQRMIQVQSLAKTYKIRQAELEDYAKEMEQLQEKLKSSKSAKIKVRGTVYAGVELAISDQTMVVKDQRSFSQFSIEKGEIAIQPV